jgi:hypothetical protein
VFDKSSLPPREGQNEEGRFPGEYCGFWDHKASELEKCLMTAGSGLSHEKQAPEVLEDVSLAEVSQLAIE